MTSSALLSGTGHPNDRLLMMFLWHLQVPEMVATPAQVAAAVKPMAAVQETPVVSAEASKPAVTEETKPLGI